jgi:hypothetical protein
MIRKEFVEYRSRTPRSLVKGTFFDVFDQQGDTGLNYLSGHVAGRKNSCGPAKKLSSKGSNLYCIGNRDCRRHLLSPLEEKEASWRQRSA